MHNSKIVAALRTFIDTPPDRDDLIHALAIDATVSLIQTLGYEGMVLLIRNGRYQEALNSYAIALAGAADRLDEIIEG